MRKKLFTLLLAVAASVGTMFASDTQVDGIWYDFDSSTKTASVTYRGDNYYTYVDEYSGSVVIPSTVTYNSVTYSVNSIGKSAFDGCTHLTSVTIPNSVTSIGEDAFYNCSGLTSVTIPNSVTSIGDHAFRDCYGLTSVTIPNSVTSIGEYAFIDCYGLTSITIPNSVTSIGSYAFRGCTGLTSINVENGNSFYDSRNNCNAIIETATNTLIVGCMNTIIPNSVTSIGECAFEGCTHLTSVTIPNSVTSIGRWAFDDCTGLASVTIPNSVTSIGEWAFSGCSSLTSVTIPNSVTSIEYGAFYGCSGLTSIYNYAIKPQMIDESVFDGDPIEGYPGVDKFVCKLYVPENSIPLYRVAIGWRDFAYIEAIETSQRIETTSINLRPSKLLKDGQIFILRGEKEYTITGQEVK